MIAKLFIPKLGMTMEKATIAEWRHEDGDQVEKDSPILVIDTEKVANEIEAPISGKLIIAAAVGEELPCGAIVGLIAETQQEYDAAREELKVATAIPKTSEQPKSGHQVLCGDLPVAQTSKGRIMISPLARTLAEQHNVDISKITGTGPGGRITKQDVEMAIQSGQLALKPAETAGQPAPVISTTVPRREGKRIMQVTPLKGIRKAISDHMHRSHGVSAPVTVMFEIDMSEMSKFRNRLLEKGQAQGMRITYTDIFIMIVAKALKNTPQMNSSLIDQEIIIWEDINVGFAVSVKLDDGQSGLVVPVIRNVDKLSLGEISVARKKLMDKARIGKLAMDEMLGGTFTITNTGTFTSLWHVQTPIIHQPQSAILGTSGIVDRPVVINGAIVIRPVMPVSLTFDHRIMDGGPPAQFMSQVHEMMADPKMMLV